MSRVRTPLFLLAVPLVLAPLLASAFGRNAIGRGLRSLTTVAKRFRAASYKKSSSPPALAMSKRGASPADDDALLDHYVEQVSEFSSRARANVYFPNPQSIFNGVQFNFVNVGTGNLTFLRRDMVASGRIPLVLARVYDSDSTGTEDFGPGWRLSAAETISPGQGKVRLITESGSVIDFVRDGENGFRLEKDYPSDYTSLVSTAPDALRASLRTGFVKDFKLIRGQFRLTQVTDRNGNVVRLSYEDGRVVRIQNANRSIALSRDKKGRIVLAQDDQGRRVSYAYDDGGRLVEADDLGGNAWKYGYAEGRRLATATDPLQRLNFAVAYDGPGRVTRLQLPSGIIQNSYDSSARSTTVIDRKQLTTRFFQNEEGITTRVVNALGEETSIALDSARNVASLSRNGLLLEKMEYDQQHHLVFRQSFGEAGAVNRQYAYHAATGLLTSIQSTTGDNETFSYDARGNLASANLPDGPRSFEHSAAGDLSAFAAQTTNLKFTPDADGLIASITDRRRVEYSYDPAGNLTSTKVFDAKGTQVNGQKLEMNASYQLVRWTLFDGTETTFQYDSNGNLTQIAKGDSITRFQYDALDRLVAVDTPDGQRLTYAYKPGERSLVEQYEHASVPVADLRNTGFTFGNSFAAMNSRPLTAPFGAVRFSERLGAFQLANSDGSEIVRPHEAVEAALAKLHLFQAGMTPEDLRSGFNAPFNNMFVPAEYLTINCCPECYGGPHGWICPPCDPPPPPPPPSVSVSCTKTHLALGPTAPANTANGSCTAAISPSGGTFIWNVVTNTSNVPITLNGNGATATYSAANPSQSLGDLRIHVSYTVDGQSASADSEPITVHKPAALKVVSDTTNPTGMACQVLSLSNPGDGTCNVTTTPTTYTSYLRTRQYSVLDHLSPANEFVSVGISNATVTETVPYTTTCPNLVLNTGTSSQTTFPDSFFLCHACCQPGGPGCTAQTNPLQTIYVNGLSVRTETIVWTRSSVTLTP